MALKSGSQYIEELKRMRPNVYKWGELIEDVTAHPATASAVKTVAGCYDASFAPDTEAIYTTVSWLTGEKAHRWNTIQTEPKDVHDNARMKRDAYRKWGTCPGSNCAGWTIVNALWGVTYDMDKEYGTSYHERLRKFALFMEENALATCGALTDAKGNRAMKAGDQPNPDVYLRVVEEREDGIVLNGYKAQICGAASAQYILACPTTAFGEDEKEYCVACALPRDAEGVTLVETRKPSDTRVEEDGWDGIKSGTTQAYIIFDHVFVPKEFVFMNGEYRYTGSLISNFTAIYRAAIGACVAGQGDVMIGAALALARTNGLKRKVFQDKLTQMSINNDVTFGLGLGAIYCGGKHESGVYYPDPLLAHATKIQVATLPYQTKLLAQEIAGGIAETGCMPSYKDLMSVDNGEKLLAALTAATNAEDRIKLARLVEWLTVGAGIPGCMHGGGSPDTAKMVVRVATPWEQYVDYACSIAGTDETPRETK
jgi:4-hydroxybutyryl-CoA dehydratase/vinylacetyl-CoA-Delta-isomerase